MIRFLLQILAATTGVLLAIFLIMLLVIGAFAEESTAHVPDGAWLVLDDSFAINERGGIPSLAGLVVEGVEPELPLRKIVGAIDAAAIDSRIEGIALYNSMGHHGWAALVELRDALARFSASGKPIRAYADSYDEAGLYLASVADEITVAPLGMLGIDGPAAELMYFAEALDKAGVEIQVSRVGRYKSAVEPFLRDSISEENRVQIQALLDEMHNGFVNTVAAARGIAPEELWELTRSEGIITPQRAVELGLIDRAEPFDVYLDELETEIYWDDDAGAFAQVGIRTWLEFAKQPNSKRRALHVAVVYAEGEIVDGESEDAVGGDTLARELRYLRVDDEVDAVVLRIDSPGGSASASEVILREMQLLQEVKPVVVSMGAVAASGGYWIACHADRIIAHEQTITGSIGVFGMFPNVEVLLGKIGVHVDTVKIGPTADIFSPYRRKSEAELARVQVWIDAIYEAFLDRVVAGRGLEREVVAEIAQGRVWSGAAALELGLIDATGGLADAVEIAAQLAGSGDYSVEYMEPEMDEFDTVLQNLAGFDDFPLTQVGPIALPAGVRELLAIGRRLTEQRSAAVQARLPYAIVIR